MSTPFSASTIAELSAGEPSWLQHRRRDAWRTYEDLPLPTKRDLEWQPFNLKALDLTKLDPGWVKNPALTVALRQLTSDPLPAGVIFSELREAVRAHPDLVRSVLGSGLPASEP